MHVPVQVGLHVYLILYTFSEVWLEIVGPLEKKRFQTKYEKCIL